MVFIGQHVEPKVRGSLLRGGTHPRESLVPRLKGHESRVKRVHTEKILACETISLAWDTRAIHKSGTRNVPHIPSSAPRTPSSVDRKQRFLSRLNHAVVPLLGFHFHSRATAPVRSPEAPIFLVGFDRNGK
jgi:hypothetical protein